MTPSAHKTAAEAVLTTVDTSASSPVLDAADLIVMEAHAHLAQAAGTGTHYTAAEAAIAAATGPYGAKLRSAQAAVAHAILADR